MGDRSRSRSPRRQDDGERGRPKKTGGFRWKEKRRDDDDRGDERRLDRGYRDRGDRARSPRRDRDGERYRDGPRDRRRDDQDAPQEDRERKEKKEKKKKEKKPAAPQSSEPMIVVHVNDRLGTKAAIPCLASDPISKSSTIFFFPCMISGNWRAPGNSLGKSTDARVELFKAQVAARIGREPHEILLKRQGERPFKDQLTLEDYGVSNGVQLDL